MAIGLYTRWFHRGALIAGWVAGMVAGFWMLWEIAERRRTKRAHFGGSAFALSHLGLDTKMTVYAGFVAVVVNLLVAVVVDADPARREGRRTAWTARPTDDYLVDAGDPASSPGRSRSSEPATA